jgi:hypothetical protein
MRVLYTYVFCESALTLYPISPPGHTYNHGSFISIRRRALLDFDTWRSWSLHFHSRSIGCMIPGTAAAALVFSFYLYHK